MKGLILAVVLGLSMISGQSQVTEEGIQYKQVVGEGDVGYIREFMKNYSKEGYKVVYGNSEYVVPSGDHRFYYTVIMERTISVPQP